MGSQNFQNIRATAAGLSAVFAVCAAYTPAVNAFDMMTPVYMGGVLDDGTNKKSDKTTQRQERTAERRRIAYEQIRAALADPTISEDELSKAFMVELPSDSGPRKAVNLYPSHASSCRQDVLGDEVFKALNEQQVDAVLECMTGKASTRTSLLLLGMLVGVGSMFYFGDKAATALDRRAHKKRNTLKP